MRPTLRPFQNKLISDVYHEWDQAEQDHVLMVSPTGSGKTVVFSSIMNDRRCPSIAIAHRKEIVSQISLALAKNEVRHRIIAPLPTIRDCVQIQKEELGHSFYNASAPVSVASVDTLINMPDDDPFLQSCRLWVLDEAHHVLKSNKWGRALAKLPNAKGLGATATPLRHDGLGLGAHNDGVFESMVLAPNMREIINMGYMSDYRIFAPESDFDVSAVNVTASGDFSPNGLRLAAQRSHIVGDVVDTYLRLTPGASAITFCVSVEECGRTVEEFRRRGVPAELLTAKSPDVVRFQTIKKFKNRQILQLVNVGLFGEGFDVPAVEVVQMADPTWSFSKFSQEFGRALRVFDGKKEGIIIDHVGNVMNRHSVPDAPRVWSLERNKMITGAKADNEIKVCKCPYCAAVYLRYLGFKCPYCGETREPQSRAEPMFVDGVLSELDPATLMRLRGEAEAVHNPPRVPNFAPPVVEHSIKARHRERVAAIDSLKNTMAIWAIHRPDINNAQREFYLKFGIDVMSAQALKTKDAIELEARIRNELS